MKIFTIRLRKYKRYKLTEHNNGLHGMTSILVSMGQKCERDDDKIFSDKNSSGVEYEQ